MTSTIRLNEILKTFGLKAKCLDINQVNNYCYYDLELFSDTKVKDLQKYAHEISLAMHASGRPNFKVVHDQGMVRMEFLSPRTETLKLFDYFTNNGVPANGIPCLLGQSIQGYRVWMDIAENPHMLVAGTTGSGKSTLLHNIIANLFNYNDVMLFLVDPKRIEFSLYEEKIKSVPVIYHYDDVLELMSNLHETMESRYQDLRNGLNILDLKPIVVMIDEFADLVLQDTDNQFYLSLCKLAQKCRAARIHLIISTQRPSVKVVDGAIKANFPVRLACQVASHIDSKIILDAVGAEHLLGKGDALLKTNSCLLERLQIAYTNATEVCNFFGNIS